MPDKTKPRIIVKIASQEGSPSNPGASTVFSLVVLFSGGDKSWPYFLRHSVGVCGQKQIQSCAKDVVVLVSEEAKFLLDQAAGAQK